MSRRLEITVPNEWATVVRECLEDHDRCNLSERLEKPCMTVEVPGVKNTIFFVTVPGPVVSPTLEVLRKNGIGTNVGRIILSSIDYLKPDLSKPLTKPDLSIANMADEEKVVPPTPGKKAAPLKGFAHFQKARKTTEEMYNDISNGAQMNINTWMNLVGASIMASGGLITNVTVFIVAAMLVSPIMGPILGMTFGYRIADWPLFRTGFINEFKMAVATYTVGAIVGFILGDVGNTYKWPNSAMMPEGQGFNLIISIFVSAAAGMVLGVALTSTGGNALVGTAISAGLLPPLVNAGMLMSYSYAYAPPEMKPVFNELGMYSIFFYLTHVVTIIIVANFVFWLKDVDTRFKDGEDSNFNDIPSLVEHKRKLEEKGMKYTEREKAEFFIGHIKDEVTGLASMLTGGLLGGKKKTDEEEQDDEEEYDEEDEEEEGDGEEGEREEGEGGEEGNGEGDLEEGEAEKVKRSRSKKGSRRMFKSSTRRGSGKGRGDFSALQDDDVDEEEGGGVQMQQYRSVSQRSNMSGPDVVNPMFQSSGSADANVAAVYDFYRLHNPAKIDSVPDILEKYKGREDELLERLNKQYGVDNTAAVYEFYRKYNPTKVGSVPDILAKYKGQEQQLLVKLHKQYNVPFGSAKF